MFIVVENRAEQMAGQTFWKAYQHIRNCGGNTFLKRVAEHFETMDTQVVKIFDKMDDNF